MNRMAQSGCLVMWGANGKTDYFKGVGFFNSFCSLNSKIKIKFGLKSLRG
jgi:hypothetical protein